MESFFQKDVLVVAPALLGKILVRRFDDGTTLRLPITEVEAYRGEEDRACHARVGRSKRNGIMYSEGGVVYMYLIYGMYWMLNIVVGGKDEPQAVLIRGAGHYSGPGRLSKAIALDGSFYGEDLQQSERLWLEDASAPLEVLTSPRIGIDYAESPWREMPWRFYYKP